MQGSVPDRTGETVRTRSVSFVQKVVDKREEEIALSEARLSFSCRFKDIAVGIRVMARLAK